MSFRRGISMLAIWGVLLHAALVVRHNAMALNHHFLGQELAQTLGVICHSAGGMMKVVAPEGSAPIDLTEQQSECPICSGMLTAVAALPTVAMPPPPMTSASIRIASRAVVIHERMAAAWPPPRGPPSIV